MNERIVCAACRTRHGDILLGARHWDEQMHKHRKLVDHSEKYGRADQGFWTNRSRFVSRVVAWNIAEAEGQILRRVGGDGPDNGGLFSENLY